jgi:adenylyl cyclase-associated protein
LESIVSRLEQNLPPQLRDSVTSPIHTKVSSSYSQTDLTSPDERFLPTVLPHLEKRLERIEQEQKRRSNELSENIAITPIISKQEPKAMSVNAYEDIILGPLAQFLELSTKIGDDVVTQADFVKKAFDAQFQYVTMASQSAAPQQSEISNLLKPTSDQIMAIQSFREKHRTSKFFNHLSAISESIPALGWVCIVSIFFVMKFKQSITLLLTFRHPRQDRM